MYINTTGTIAEELGVKREEVAYAVHRLAIKPLGRAGVARVFSKEATTKVKQFLNRKKQTA